MVEVSDQIGKEEDEEALKKEENDGHCVQAFHSFGLFRWNRDWNERGDQDVDNFVIGWQGFKRFERRTLNTSLAYVPRSTVTFQATAGEEKPKE